MSEKVLAKLTVEDFDRFWEVFRTRGAEQRAAFGSRGSTVFRNRDKENEVWIIFDWEPAALQDFLKDSTSQEIMRSAGVLGAPESQVVEEVGQHLA